MKKLSLIIFGYDISNYLLGLVIFLLCSAPSLKIFFFTSAWNLFPVLFMILVFIIKRGKTYIHDAGAIFLFIVFFSILIISALLSFFRYLSLEALTKYSILIIITLTLPLFINKKSLEYGLFFIWIWGLLLAILRLEDMIELSRELGQHYLTLGLPIALTILVSFYYFIYSRNWLFKILNLAVIILSYKSLFTLIGRAPILFSSMIIILYLLFISFRKMRFIRLRKIALLIIPIILFLFAFNNLIPSGLKNRILNLGQSLQEEDRIEMVYKPAFSAIKTNPIGYGLDSTYNVIGKYPHNIFLEILISFGLIGLLSFIPIILLFFHACFFFFQEKNIILAFTFIAFYHFLVWNVSFNLSSAYGLLPFIASIITLHRNKNLISY